MKISKISLTILILICAVGIAAAAELPDIKVAEGYNDLGNGSYFNEAKNIEILKTWMIILKMTVTSNTP